MKRLRSMQVNENLYENNANYVVGGSAEDCAVIQYALDQLKYDYNLLQFGTEEGISFRFYIRPKGENIAQQVFKICELVHRLKTPKNLSFETQEELINKVGDWYEKFERFKSFGFRL